MAVKKTIEVSGENDMDLFSRVKAANEILQLPTDQLNRLMELAKIPKAKGYLESETKFFTLKVLLK